MPVHVYNDNVHMCITWEAVNIAEIIADHNAVTPAWASEIGWQRDQIDLLKQTVARGATDLELYQFGMFCKRTGLDPFMRQVYFIKRPQKQKIDGEWVWAEVGTIQTSIDGLRLIADRSNRYAPGPEPKWTLDRNGAPINATAYVLKKVADTWHTVAATAWFEEYAQQNDKGYLIGQWKKMPRHMLAKCAEALALRRAFPAEMSGVYSDDEMGQADKNPPDVEDTPAVEMTSTENQPAPLKREEIEALDPNDLVDPRRVAVFRLFIGARNITEASVLTWASETLHREYTNLEQLSNWEFTDVAETVRDYAKKNMALPSNGAEEMGA